MTLLNFETHFRPAKIAKAIEMFNKGQVIELRKAKIVWIGKMKIGLYKVQISLYGINIGSATCPCDSRSRSGYCEHKLAVLFALRKELDLYERRYRGLSLWNSRYCGESVALSVISITKFKQLQLTWYLQKLGMEAVFQQL
jgi:hypothetical protein